MSRIIFTLAILYTCFFGTTFCTLCEKYFKNIQQDDLLLNYGTTLNCLSKKAEELIEKKYSKKSSTFDDKVEKKMQKLKLECFAELKNPSEELTQLFQCFKNYYEAKFDTTLNIATLQNQPIGTDSASWDDEELTKKLQEEHEDRNQPTNVMLYMFCVLLAVAIISLVLATIYSRYRVFKNKQSVNLLGQSSAVEFGGSDEKYKQQIDMN